MPEVSSSAFSGSEEVRQRRFEFSYHVTILNIPRDAEKIEVSVPVPRSDDQQAVINQSVVSNLDYTRYTDPEYGNQVLIFKGVRGNDSELPDAVEIQIDVTVNRREAGALLSHVAASDDNSANQKRLLKRFLGPDRLVPIDGRIAKEAREVVKDDMETIEKARALYDHLFATMSYDKSGQGWGMGDAIYACDVRSGNCTDIHSLFIGMARALGIPARFVMGFPLPENKSSGDIPGYHCWAEFYVTGSGWVPVDISEAIKHPEKKDYFFGRLDPNRVAFSIGRDIQILTSTGSEELNYFIYPHTLIDGQPFDGATHEFAFTELSAKQ
ncbi:MAG: transglutaminase domain-containing protein [candidate division Zixibacteria bacterium]|nr:transglutaminase domain-containing protein [candidate division Zixibacteria bacterium]